MNGLHPCTLSQQEPFAAVRRVSPLCAAFCPDSECVCGATGKANVAPTCAKNTKSQSSNAIAILRGGAAEWTRPAACGKCGKTLKMVKIEGFWTLRRESRINGWRRNRRFSCSQQPAVRTVSGGCTGAAIGACLEEITRGWRLEFHKRRCFKGFRRAAPQIGGL